MVTTRSIQFKAAFLLVVFALNTIVGFACSMGVDMGFNTSHHGPNLKGTVHIHKDGKKHLHKAGKDKHHHDNTQAASKKDDCCNNKVIKLQTSDKSFQYTHTVIKAPEFTINSFFQLLVFNTLKGVRQKEVDYYFHPPPRDIRIAIQSFLI